MEQELVISLVIKEVSWLQYPSAPGPDLLRDVNGTSTAIWGGEVSLLFWGFFVITCKISDLLGNKIQKSLG